MNVVGCVPDGGYGEALDSLENLQVEIDRHHARARQRIQVECSDLETQRWAVTSEVVAARAELAVCSLEVQEAQTAESRWGATEVALQLSIQRAQSQLDSLRMEAAAELEEPANDLASPDDHDKWDVHSEQSTRILDVAGCVRARNATQNELHAAKALLHLCRLEVQDAEVVRRQECGSEAGLLAAHEEALSAAAAFRAQLAEFGATERVADPQHFDILEESCLRLRTELQSLRHQQPGYEGFEPDDEDDMWRVTAARTAHRVLEAEKAACQLELSEVGVVSSCHSALEAKLVAARDKCCSKALDLRPRTVALPASTSELEQSRRSCRYVVEEVGELRAELASATASAAATVQSRKDEMQARRDLLQSELDDAQSGLAALRDQAGYIESIATEIGARQTSSDLLVTAVSELAESVTALENRASALTLQVGQSRQCARQVGVTCNHQQTINALQQTQHEDRRAEAEQARDLASERAADCIADQEQSLAVVQRELRPAQRRLQNAAAAEASREAVRVHLQQGLSSLLASMADLRIQASELQNKQPSAIEAIESRRQAEAALAAVRSEVVSAQESWDSSVAAGHRRGGELAQLMTRLACEVQAAARGVELSEALTAQRKRSHRSALAHRADEKSSLSISRALATEAASAATTARFIEEHSESDTAEGLPAVSCGELDRVSVLRTEVAAAGQKSDDDVRELQELRLAQRAAEAQVSQAFQELDRMKDVCQRTRDRVALLEGQGQAQDLVMQELRKGLSSKAIAGLASVRMLAERSWPGSL